MFGLSLLLFSGGDLWKCVIGTIAKDASIHKLHAASALSVVPLQGYRSLAG